MARKPQKAKRSRADAMLAGKPASDKPVLKLLTQEFAAPEIAGIRTLWVEAVAPGLTPHRLAAILKAAEEGDPRDYLTLAEDMEERELHYTSVLGTRKRAIVGVERVVEAGGDDARSVEIAEAVEDLVALPAFASMVEHLTDALGKGYAVSEVIWETSAKQWMPSDFRDRDPRFFTFDRINRAELRLADLEDPMFGVPLPPWKFVRHVPKLKSGIPIRGGLAKPAAWAYLFKNYSLKDWVAFCEIYGMPIRVGKYANGATPEDKRALLSAVRNIGSDAAAIVPNSMTIEFIEGAGKGATAVVFRDLCEYLDKQISKLVLGQTMTTDHGAGGSGLAQAKVHENVKHDILVADATQMETTLNRDIIRPFVDLNYGPQKRYPLVRLPVPKPEDLTAFSDNLTKIVALGVRVAESDVREKFGLPEPEEGAPILSAGGLARFEREQVLDVPGQAAKPGDEPDGDEDAAEDEVTSEVRDGDAEKPPAPKPGKPAKKPAARKAVNRRGAHKAKMERRARNRAEPHHHHDEVDELDRIRDMALDGWEKQVDPMLRPIKDLVDKAKTYDEFLAGLPKALQQMDAGAFVEALASSMAIARGLGDIGTTAHKGKMRGKSS